MNRFVLSGLICVLAAGCEWIDAATAEHPNSAQLDALGDVFGSIGAFVKVSTDPASATTSDLADLHATDPYRKVLDPQGTARRADRISTALGECVTTEGTTAHWNCPFDLGGMACTAAGSGGQNPDGTVSGSSTQTCEGSAATVTVSASDVVFDKVRGMGSGVLTVQTTNPTLSGLATVTITGLGFCTGAATPAPNTGTVEVDGQGPLDGLPFDPLTLRFSDVPECGVATIE